MNIIYKYKKLEFYESIWRKSIINKKYDVNNKLFPFPIPKKKKLNQKYKKFIIKLTKIQNILESKKLFKKYKKKKHCLITKKKNIGDKIYKLFNVNWDNSLIYYMKNFNIIPSNQFYNFINNIKIKNNDIILNKKYKFPFFKLNGIIYKRFKKKYIIIKKNQWRILDALYKDGSNKIYDNKNKLKYSEHSGLIDFNNNKIDRIIVNAKKNYISEEDEEIFLPENMVDESDFEFIFHTHPKTKNRINDQIIYEFPSLGDLLNYIDNFNEGKTQGSIIIAPEGVYIIETLNNNKSLKIPEKIHDNLKEKLLDINLLAYDKYFKKYSDKYFYNKIIKDREYIKLFNNIVNKFNLNVRYIPRIKSNNNFIIPDIYLKLNIIESLNKNIT